MKLSEKLIQQFTAIAQYCGDDFGLWPQQNFEGTNAKFYFSGVSEIVTPQKFDYFAFSLWIDEKFFYFCIGTSIYQVRRYIHQVLCIDEIAVFVYLVFCKHQTFNL